MLWVLWCCLEDRVSYIHLVLEHPGWIRGKGTKKDVIRIMRVGRTRPEEDVGPLWKMGPRSRRTWQ